jgi:molecular chaperone GrpE
MPDEVSEELKCLRKENQELKTQILYLEAELDNMRKLMEKEVSRARQQALESMIMKLINVYEGLERALSGVKEKEEEDSFIKGVKILHRELEKTLKEENVEFIESVGKKFDPFIHEAVGYVANEELEDGTIIAEVARGYRLRGKLLRPARVIVVRNEKKEESSQESP